MEKTTTFKPINHKTAIMTIKQVINRIHATVEKMRPKTMDALINVVHSITDVACYGTSFRIIQYMGTIQGIRVYVTGRKNTYQLPTKNGHYAIHEGLDHFIKAGWVENVDMNGETIPDDKLTCVKFYKEGDVVFAYFPFEDFDLYGNKTAYAHIGQHSSCSPDYVKGKRLATEPEFFDLLKELQSIGYNLQVLNPLTPKF